MKKLNTLKPIIVTTLLLAAGLTSCKKSTPTPVPTANTNNPVVVPTSNLYFEATINGTAVSFQDGVSMYGAGGGDESGTEPAGWQEVQNCLVMKALTTTNFGGFYIMKTFANQPAPAEIDSMFSVKVYPYGKQSSSTSVNGIDGARVYYVDNSGVEWATDFGSGIQTGSAFSITENIANTNTYSRRISKAVFNCKLYNAAGQSMTLTNGICRLRTVYY